MFQKQVISRTVNGAVVASLVLMVGCGKPNPKPTEKIKKPVVIAKRVKVQPKTIVETSNIAVNPSFEECKNFDSGLYKKGKSSIGKPVGWTTRGQILNDFTGWATDVAHSGKRSLKIENIGGTDACWQGKPVIFKEPANAFIASIWTKAKEIKDKAGKGKFQLAFDVYLKGDNNKEIKKRVFVDISQTNHNWKQTTKKTLFSKNIVKIIPYLFFFKVTGTVWFDDISIKHINIDLSKGKVLFDSSNKKSKFNIPPFFTPILTNPKHLSDDLSADAKAIALEKQATIYEVKGTRTIKSTGFIPIKKGNIYKLSGEFKTVQGGPSKLFFGYAPYTKDKRFISVQSVNYIQGTATELVKPCKATDKIIYIKNAKNWQTKNINFIVFDIDNHGNYIDLPNFNLSSMGVEKIAKKDNYYELTLKNPCKKSYPAGTKIREHAAGNIFIYNVAVGVLVKKKWTRFSNIIATDKSTVFNDKLYPKTKYVKILMLANYQTAKETLQFRNIKMQEISYSDLIKK